MPSGMPRDGDEHGTGADADGDPSEAVRGRRGKGRDVRACLDVVR
jgi:hypothetical protein